MRGILCGIAVPVVSYDDLEGMRSVPQNVSGMSCLTILLPSLGSGKHVRYSWIWIPNQSSPSRGILDRRKMPVWASRQDLDHEHAALVTDWAFPQRSAGEFFIALMIILAGF